MVRRSLAAITAATLAAAGLFGTGGAPGALGGAEVRAAAPDPLAGIRPEEVGGGGDRTDAPAGEGEAAPWTWPALFRRVVGTHPLMDAARADLATFEAKLSQADWAYFPSFTFDGLTTLTPRVTGDALDTDTDWGTVGVYLRFDVDMVQPVYTFGKIGALQRAAARGVDVGQAQVAAARWELWQRAGEAYQGRLLARELAAVLEDGRGWLDKAQNRMERLRAEDSLDYDQLEHLRLKTRVADFHVLDAGNKLLLTQATEGLRVLLSLPPGTPVTLAPDELRPLEFTLLDADEYVALAMDHEPTLQIARRGARAQAALADSKEAELWPDLVIVGSAGAGYANEIEDQGSRFVSDPYNGSSAGAALALRWKLDVPQRLFRAEEARAKALKTHYQAEVQADLVEVKVHRLHQELVNKRHLVEVFRDSQKAARGWLTATWDTYDAGFGSFRDVMDALVQFYEKKFGYLRMVFEHNIAVMKMSGAIGYDITQATPADVPE